MRSKTILCIIIILNAISFFSCQKNEIVFNENPSLKQVRVLVFKNLTATNPYITPNKTTTIIANASGDGLKFVWKSLKGTISGKDSIVHYTGNTLGSDTISCTITDAYGNSSTKYVTVDISMELIFSKLFASDTIIPLGFTSTINATASGDDITYTWQASEGTLIGNNASVTFTAPHYGSFDISCMVSDKNNQTLTKTITLIATNQLIFKNLFADPEIIQLPKNTFITAIAYGDDLTYEWTSDNPYTVFTGRGSEVYAAICHAQSFTVNCTIKDRYGNTQSKSVFIQVIQ